MVWVYTCISLMKGCPEVQIGLSNVWLNSRSWAPKEVPIIKSHDIWTLPRWWSQLIVPGPRCAHSTESCPRSCLVKCKLAVHPEKLSQCNERNTVIDWGCGSRGTTHRKNCVTRSVENGLAWCAKHDISRVCLTTIWWWDTPMKI